MENNASEVEIIKLPKYVEGQKTTQPTTVEVKEPSASHPSPPPPPEEKQSVPSIAAQPKQAPISENSEIDRVIDPYVDEEKRKLNYYNLQVRTFPVLKELYPISNMKNKSFAEITDEIGTVMSMRADKLFIMTGFRYFNGFIETAVTKTGVVDLTGYSEMVVKNPEVIELLDIVLQQRAGFLRNMSPEMKLAGACLMTAVTCAQLNSGKKQVKDDFIKTFAKKPEENKQNKPIAPQQQPPEIPANNERKPRNVQSTPEEINAPYVIPMTINLNAN